MVRLWPKKTWLAIAVIVGVVIALYVLSNALLAPRFTDWFMAQFPNIATVQTALEAKYPQEKVEVLDQTSFNADNSDEKTRVLTVNLVGTDYLPSSENITVEKTICLALGEKSNNYTTITTQTTIEHHFLIFSARESKSFSFSCP